MFNTLCSNYGLSIDTEHFQAILTRIWPDDSLNGIVEWIVFFLLTISFYLG
jgi:hypothetical protein